MDIGKEIAERIINESTPIIALYPGKFKPAHKGHFEVVKTAASKVDEVHVIISNNTTEGYTPELSLKIWKQYKTLLPENVQIRIAKSTSPITEIYNEVKNQNNNYIVIYGKDDEERYNSIKENRDKYFNVDIVNAGNIEGLSATSLREAIGIRDLNKIKTLIPEGIKLNDFLLNFQIHEKKDYHELLVAMAKRKDPDRLTPLGKKYLPEPIQEIFKKNHAPTLNKAIEYVCNNLQIEKPEITLINNPNYVKQHSSFGGYIPSEKKINAVIYNRNMADIMRSIAHELYHFKQDLEGRLTVDAGKDGDEFENEANSYAGKIMREIGRNIPEIFE